MHLTTHTGFAMPKALAAPATDRSLVTPTDVRRFDKAVTVRDRNAFLHELDRLVREKLAAAANAASEASALTETLRRKAESLRAAASWSPSAGDVQRGRAEMLREFERPQNLPLAEFVRLAHKSRQQIYKDIAARRLLALDVGRRGQRIPDWQLTPPGLQLTRAVLLASEDLDAWTIYRALAEPSEALGGQAPAASVNRGNVEATARVVLASLGVQDAERGGAHA
nr:integrase [Methylibium petroleiphilum]